MRVLIDPQYPLKAKPPTEPTAPETPLTLTMSPLTLPQQPPRQRRSSSSNIYTKSQNLWIPNSIEAFKKSKSQEPLPDHTHTISLSRDIFTTIAVLHVYDTWDIIDANHRRQLIFLVFICILLQFGLLGTLTIEVIVSPPWNDEENRDVDDLSFHSAENILLIITKLFCVLSVLMYLFKELYEMKAIRKARREIEVFRNKCHYVLFTVFYIYNTLLSIMAMALSVVLISTSHNGFDAVLNAVAILFVLDIDNWLYTMVKTHEYIEDSLYDLKYQKNKEVTSYYLAKNKYLASFCVCGKLSDRARKAKGEKTMVSMALLSTWFILIIATTILCLGIISSQTLLQYIGGGMLSIIVLYVFIMQGVNTIGHCCFRRKNTKNVRNFIDEELMIKCGEHVVLNKSRLKTDLSKQILIPLQREIKNQFANTCYEYFITNGIGVQETEHEVKSQLIAALDEYYKKCDKTRIDVLKIDFGAVTAVASTLNFTY